MAPPDTPMVARWGTEHPSAPLVVALHGNGTSEHSLIEISPWLPHGPVAYVSVRAPLQNGSGFCWYPETERGVPDPEGLATVAEWFLRWLDTEGDPDRPVILLGFREGVTFASALMLTEPHRWAGGALLYGALPFDVGVPMTRGRLAGMPVFLAHGTDDPRTPAELLARTWEWLTKHSGAPVWAEREPGGAQLAGKVVGDLGTWLGDRLDHLRAHGENPIPDHEDAEWPTLPSGRLPRRSGDQPDVTSGLPQHQLTQTAPPDLQAKLWDQITGLAHVIPAPSRVGVTGTRALLLDEAHATGPDTAFVVPDDREFAHMHPAADGSLHVVLSDAQAYDALAKGWGVAHPLAGVRLSPGMVLIYGPRDPTEVEVVAGIVAAAHHHVTTG